MGPLRPLYFCRTLQLHYTVSFFSLIETKLHTKQNNFIENVAKFFPFTFFTRAHLIFRISISHCPHYLFQQKYKVFVYILEL